MSEENVWRMIRDERSRLAEDLEGLSVEQWRHPTLCGEWDVEHVVAHLTAAASVGRLRWITSMLGAAFRPAVHNERRLREHLGSTPQETLASFRAVVDSTIAPTGDTAAYLGEVIVHAEDIRQPLGIGASHGSGDDAGAIEAATAVAEFYASRDFAVPSKTVAKGLRLVATDGPFSAGAGPEVTGPTLAMIMVMAGRAGHLGQLSGPGVQTLAERIG